MNTATNASHQVSATSLPQATYHQVEHMFDSPMTFDEYDQLLQTCQQQTSFLSTILQAIQSDEDVAYGFQVSNLAQIGEHLAGNWMREIKSRRQAFDVAFARSQK